MYHMYINNIPMPIVPSEIETIINNRNETLDLINGLEVNQIKNPGLTDISFELRLPYGNNPYGNYYPPDYYLKNFESLKTSLQPFQFIVLRNDMQNNVMWDTNISVTLEDYKILEDAENVFDVIVEINLKQYKPYGTKLVTIQNDGTVVISEDTRPANKTVPTRYTVQSGDSLWRICKTILGDEKKVSEIAKLNKITDPNNLTVGTVIEFV